ncbi:UNKNOWN [Stylonychia lemnae]|uniref:Uncharacterized protein n=1 Tax=Stylonychia lemnae TaxID=5949 RepID=A0A077ZYG2_STYLE|nr:UNKNOWN [Stylonychia lemnae]|eukprot:CDW73576.1 UNKNOWN [Stylonychia lemnae]
MVASTFESVKDNTNTHNFKSILTPSSTNSNKNQLFKSIAAINNSKFQVIKQQSSENNTYFSNMTHNQSPYRQDNAKNNQYQSIILQNTDNRDEIAKRQDSQSSFNYQQISSIPINAQYLHHKMSAQVSQILPTIISQTSSTPNLFQNESYFRTISIDNQNNQRTANQRPTIPIKFMSTMQLNNDNDSRKNLNDGIKSLKFKSIRIPQYSGQKVESILPLRQKNKQNKTPKTKFEQDLIFSKLQKPTLSKAKKVLDKRPLISMYTKTQIIQNNQNDNDYQNDQAYQDQVLLQQYEDQQEQIPKFVITQPLSLKREQVISAFLDKRQKPDPQQDSLSKKNSHHASYQKIVLPASSAIVKRVTNFEKDVLSSLLNQYDQDNLDKINREIELNKASKHDKLIQLINHCQSNTLDYIKEPQKKTEEQLEKLQKEIEYYNRSKKSRLTMIDGISVNGNQIDFDPNVIRPQQNIQKLKSKQQSILDEQKEDNLTELQDKEYQIDLRKNIMKQNNIRQAFKLIEYDETDVNKVPVVNTIEKEEILSQEEDIDQANIRVKAMEKYIDKAHCHIKETFQKTQNDVATLENEKLKTDFRVDQEALNPVLAQKLEEICEKIKFGDTLQVYKLLQFGQSALHIAVKRRQYAVIDVLLHFNADPFNNLNNLLKSPYKLALKIGDVRILDMFNEVKNETYPFNHSKFDSLQYLDSIRAPEQIKFQKHQEMISQFKVDLEDERKKKEEYDKKRLNGQTKDNNYPADVNSSSKELKFSGLKVW